VIDPKFALMRLEAERLEIWVNASSLIAGNNLLLGADPKKDDKKVAQSRVLSRKRKLAPEDTRGQLLTVSIRLAQTLMTATI
jgi:hypothetical protein